MQLIIHPEAQEEIADAARYYQSQKRGLGDEFVDEVNHVVERIRDAPDIGSPLGSSLRRSLLRRFPFSVLYRVRDDQLEVLAVMHHRRRPGYWRKRL